MDERMTLFWASGSPPCWRVLITLHEKGIKDYTSKQVDMMKLEHKSDEILKLNPRGQVPTFKHGNVVINESLGICDYIEEMYKAEGKSLLPKDIILRSLVFQKYYEVLNIETKTRNVVYYSRFWEPNPDVDIVELCQRVDALKAEIDQWEAYLKTNKSKYLVGDNFTKADIIFFPQLAFLKWIGLDFGERYAAISEYYDNLRKRPSIRDTWPPSWQEMPRGPPLLAMNGTKEAMVNGHDAC